MMTAELPRDASGQFLSGRERRLDEAIGQIDVTRVAVAGSGIP